MKRVNSIKSEGMRTPLILEIKGNSLDDGPGIRSVIFFKGCPLSCTWCHNPESKRASVELAFDPKECIGCDTCIEVCTEKALSRKNPLFIDRRRCTLCFACVENCPSGALSRVGTEMTVDEIVEKVLIDKPFFDTSGGGATLSGGEPTMYMAVTSELLRSLKEHGIHTLIETCGLFDYDEFTEMLLPVLDIIYYDIKLIESEEHRRYCGTPNEQILDNFMRLLEITGSATTLLPRTPLIPNITDSESNLKGIAAFLKKNGVTKAALLQYNPLWHEKSEKIGAENPHKANKEMKTWMNRDHFKRCREIFSEAGIEVC